MNYYNDNDPTAAAWLRELIKHNLIPAGDVDERSIKDVTGSDLKGYTQCHFFAGIGGWSEALRIAGWGSNIPVWTGSCPCQPFSSAGKRKGTADERHLWPDFFRLIRECKPNIIFGEQVEKAIGMGWLDGVFADLETESYTCGAAVLGAHSVGAPHIRQRLYWVADTNGKQVDTANQGGFYPESGGGGRISGVGDSKSNAERKYRKPETGDRQQIEVGGSGISSGLEYPAGNGRGSRRTESDGRGASRGCGESNFWSNAIWLPCRDGKARRIEPESFPLANGIPGRVGLLRGYGNAIVPEVAAEFIKAYMDIARGLSA